MTVLHSPTPEDVMAFVDGEMTGDAAIRMQRHLAGCEACRQVAEDVRHVSEETRAWHVEEPPASLQPPRRNLGDASRVRVWWRRPAIAIGVPAAAALILVAGALVTRPQRFEDSAESHALSTALGGTRAPRAAEPGETLKHERQDRGAGTVDTDRKGPSIVRTAKVRLSTPDVDRVRAAIDRIIADAGGFVGQLNASNDRGQRSLQATLRVPAARLDAVLTALRALARVLHESQNADDVTDEAIDLDARLANARMMEKRLTELLGNRTGRLSDVLEMERELARVRTDAERLDAQRKNLARRIDLAVVSLEIVEEREPTVSLGPEPVPTRIKQAVVDGIGSAGSSLIALTLVVLRAGPTLLLWGVLLGLPAWSIARRRALR